MSVKYTNQEQIERQKLISGLILHDIPPELIYEISNEVATEELQHLLSLAIQSRLVKGSLFEI